MDTLRTDSNKAIVLAFARENGIETFQDFLDTSGAVFTILERIGETCAGAYGDPDLYSDAQQEAAFDLAGWALEN
jgi:hypothetical protein